VMASGSGTPHASVIMLRLSVGKSAILLPKMEQHLDGSMKN
jgi:hypothetical protein